MKHLIAATTFTFFFLSSTAMAIEQQIVQILVGQLTCPSCVYIVGSSINSVAGVEILGFKEGATPIQGIFTVSYDDAVTTSDMIIEAIQSNGYPATLFIDERS